MRGGWAVVGWPIQGRLFGARTKLPRLPAHRAAHLPTDQNVETTLIFFFFRVKDRWSGILKNTKQHARALGSFVFLYKSMLYALKLLRESRLHAPASAASRSSTLDDINNHRHAGDAFVAGLVAGYAVFGHPGANTGLSSINQQMVLYVFSRIFLGACKYLLDRLLEHLSTVAPEPSHKASHNGHSHNGHSHNGHSHGHGHNHHLKHVKGAIGVIDFATQARRLSPRARALSNAAWAAFASLSWGIVMYLFRSDSTLLQHSMIHSMKNLYVDSESWMSFWDFL